MEEDEAEIVEPEGHLTALVIASDRTEREAVSRALQAVGMQVVPVRDPYQAVVEFSMRPARLVVLSLEGLAKRDRKVLRVFHRLAPEVRVLILATEARRTDVLEFLATGADTWLPSPVYDKELGLVARSLIRTDGADGLTHLPNKSACNLAFVREIARARREGNTLGFALLDLDFFRKVNANYGYLSTDHILADVAKLLRAQFRVTDVVCRWGGEEFAVLLTGLPADRKSACKDVCLTLDRARERVAAHPFRTPKGELVEPHITVSGGFALLSPEDATTTPDDLFNEANNRLHHAKGRGRNRIRGECACDEGAGPSSPRPPTGPTPV